MAKLANTNSPPLVPAASQPAQLQLFRLVSDDAYSNAFDFYESIPRFIVARGATHVIKRNADGTAAHAYPLSSGTIGWHLMSIREMGHDRHDAGRSMA